MSAHLLLISAASGCTVTVADSLYGTVRYDMSVTGIRLALALHCVALPCVALPYEYNRGSEAPRHFWAQVMVIIKGPHLDNPTSDIYVHPAHDKALPIQHTSLVTATTCEWTPSILDGRSYNCQLSAASCRSSHGCRGNVSLVRSALWSDVYASDGNPTKLDSALVPMRLSQAKPNAGVLHCFWRFLRDVDLDRAFQTSSQTSATYS
jgi:hypothetical protein